MRNKICTKSGLTQTFDVESSVFSTPTIFPLVFPVYSGEVSANLSLANYVRDRAGLTGTKIMCAQVHLIFSCHFSLSCHFGLKISKDEKFTLTKIQG